MGVAPEGYKWEFLRVSTLLAHGTTLLRSVRVGTAKSVAMEGQEDYNLGKAGCSVVTSREDARPPGHAVDIEQLLPWSDANSSFELDCPWYLAEGGLWE